MFFDLLNVELLRGLLMKDKWSTRAGFKAHCFRYQGNEYVMENGLNWMDFNFRQLGLP